MNEKSPTPPRRKYFLRLNRPKMGKNGAFGEIKSKNRRKTLAKNCLFDKK